LKKSQAASVIRPEFGERPSSFDGPIIVNVLPLPVCPYAKHVAFTPWKTDSISGAAVFW
jgi:hypothetical protein